MVNLVKKKLKMILFKINLIRIVILVKFSIWKLMAITNLIKSYRVIYLIYNTNIYLYQIYVFNNFDIIKTFKCIFPFILTWVLLFVFILIFELIKKNSKNLSFKQKLIKTSFIMLYIIPLTLFIGLSTPIFSDLHGLSGENLIFHAVDFNEPLDPQFQKYKDRSLDCIEKMEQLTSSYRSVKPLNDNIQSSNVINTFYNTETADWTLNSERAERTLDKMIQMHNYNPKNSWGADISMIDRRLEDARDDYDRVFYHIDETRK